MFGANPKYFAAARRDVALASLITWSLKETVYDFSFFLSASHKLRSSTSAASDVVSESMRLIERTDSQIQNIRTCMCRSDWNVTSAYSNTCA